jgi:hypothetical protein
VGLESVALHVRKGRTFRVLPVLLAVPSYRKAIHSVAVVLEVEYNTGVANPVQVGGHSHRTAKMEMGSQNWRRYSMGWYSTIAQMLVTLSLK